MSGSCRVLDGDDVDGFVRDVLHAGIQRRRLTGTCRAGDEHHAVRRGDRAQDVLVRAILVAHRLELQREAAGVQDPEHGLLPTDDR